MNRSLVALLIATFVLRVSTAVTGTMLVFYIAHINHMGGSISSEHLAALDGGFYVTELGGALAFGVLADRFGRKAVMLLGPLFGAIAVFLTGLTSRLPILMITRLLEGASTAASVPSTLGYIAAETADNEVLRGRVVAAFELVTLGGLLAVGPALGGLLFEWLGPPAFFVNCGFYLVSFAMYAYGVVEMRGVPAAGEEEPAPGARRYARVFLNRKVLLFAPTWIAINAILGLWRSQAPYLLTGESTFKDPGQMLLHGFTPSQIGIGMAVLSLFFGAGILFWGNSFGRFRRSSIMLYGLAAFAVATVDVFLINRAFGVPPVVIGVLLVVLVAALFALAGATPAALGLLADVSEGFHADRSAIMGLYSVFLGVGQVLGIAMAGIAASRAGIDGLVAATGILIVIALAALVNLRNDEHHLAPASPHSMGMPGLIRSLPVPKLPVPKVPSDRRASDDRPPRDAG